METFASIAAIISVSVLMATQSCERKPLEHVPVTENVSFDKDIKPIMIRSCVECHSSGSRDYTRFINAFTMRHSIYNRVAVSKDMPLGRYMSDEDRALIRDWVNQGSQK